MAFALITRYFLWHFFEMPKELLKGWKNIVFFTLNYFSLPLLLRTFFSPWRRISWTYRKRGFQPGLIVETLLSNLISRVLGAIIRTGVILVGLISTVFALAAGIFLLVGWFILPLLIIFGFYYGFRAFI